MLDIQLSPFSLIFLFIISWGSLEAGLGKMRNVWAAQCNTAAVKRLIISEQEMEKPYNSFWLPRGFCLSLLLIFFRYRDHHLACQQPKQAAVGVAWFYLLLSQCQRCVWYFTGHMTTRIEILCVPYRNWGELWHQCQQLRSKSAWVPALDGQAGQEGVSGQGTIMWWSLCWIWLAPRT